MSNGCVYLRDLFAGVRRLQEQPRAVEVKADAFAPRQRHHLLHLGGVEDFALLAAHRRFNRDHRDARGHAPGARLVEEPLDLVGRERRAARRQRHQRDVAQRLHAVAAVLIDVAVGLHDGAARTARECADRQLIGKRAGRHEHRALLAEDARELRLQLLHHAAEDVRVGRDPLFFGQTCEQGAILGRRQPDAVPAQADDAIRRVLPRALARALTRAKGRPDGADRAAEAPELEKSPPIQLRHGKRSRLDIF